MLIWNELYPKLAFDKDSIARGSLATPRNVSFVRQQKSCELTTLFSLQEQLLV